VYLNSYGVLPNHEYFTCVILMFKCAAKLYALFFFLSIGLSVSL
jgi:hypothetical protein